MSLSLQPIDLDEAKAFIRLHHSTHRPPKGWKFGVAVNDGEKVVGVAMVGRPVAKGNQDGWTLEVTRCCTDRTPHVASMLYGADARASKAIGYRRIITYLGIVEHGTSLKAAGWKQVFVDENGEKLALSHWEKRATTLKPYIVRGRSWSCPSRPRVDTYPPGAKTLWEAA